MSGETGVETAVHGAIQAVRDFNSRVILVGDEETVGHAMFRFEADAHKVEIVGSDDVIDMTESPARAVRAKPNSSVMVAARLVKEGRAEGFFSPGTTGAPMAAASA